MPISRPYDAPAELTQGADSGPVKDKIKTILAFESGGQCYHPDCDTHLSYEGTNIGECAHIIPRKVGEVREDWKTPLNVRPKLDNLIYLCRTHHKIIDNPDNEYKYPSSILLQWKAAHEDKVRSGELKVGHIPKYIEEAIQKNIAALGNQISSDIQLSTELCGSILSSAKELIRRRYLDRAETLLFQADYIINQLNNEKYESELEVIKALLSWRKGDIPRAKERYLDVLSRFEHVEGMIDYVELCSSYPEPFDEKNIYEDRARSISPENPRLTLVDLLRQYQLFSPIEKELPEEEWPDEVWKKCQFCLTYALHNDLKGDITKREYYMNYYSQLIPESPRPELFHIIFKVHDIVRARALDPEVLATAAAYISEQESAIFSDGKDPLDNDDYLHFLVKKVVLYSIKGQYSIDEPKQLGQIRDQFFQRISNSYFGNSLESALLEILAIVLPTKDQWNNVINLISASSVSPKDELIDLLFIVGRKIGVGTENLCAFSSDNGKDNFCEILNCIDKKNTQRFLELFNDQSDKFKILFLSTEEDLEIANFILKNAELPTDDSFDRTFLQINLHAKAGEYEKAVECFAKLDTTSVTTSYLAKMNDFAYRADDNSATISTGIELLKRQLPEKYSADLSGIMASAYFHSGDDTNAQAFAMQALENKGLISQGNKVPLIDIAINSLLALDLNNDAADLVLAYREEIIEQYELGILFADTFLKSTKENKGAIALDIINQAMQYSPKDDERIYLAAYLVINELTSMGIVSAENAKIIKSGCFVKLTEIDDDWFFVGDEAYAPSTIELSENDPRHTSLIGKSLGEEVDWPADRYSGIKPKKKVAQILSRGTYYLARGQEELRKLAERGDPAVFAVEMADSEGEFSLSNLERLHREEFADQENFFDKYCANPLPFSILCAVTGSVQQAIGKIVNQSRGFIRINTGNIQCIRDQYDLAERLRNGEPYFIDTLAALVLSESGLMDRVVESCPNVHVPTSVLKSIRDIAEKFRQSESQLGHLGFSHGKIQLREKSPDEESTVRKRLLHGASIIDESARKHVGRDKYTVSQESEWIDEFLPRWIVDTFRLAKLENSLVLSDDLLTFHAYGLAGEDILSVTSSYSLCRVLCESNIISWRAYLEFFSLISSYRYYLLPLSIDDLERTVLQVDGGKIVQFRPNDVELLHLPLTLSRQYGVSDEVVVRILSMFFARIAVREDVTVEMAEEIYPRFIIGALKGRNSHLCGLAIGAACGQLVQNNRLAGRSAWTKVESLQRQIGRYIREFNPIIEGVPSLLKGR